MLSSRPQEINFLMFFALWNHTCTNSEMFNNVYLSLFTDNLNVTNFTHLAFDQSAGVRLWILNFQLLSSK